jgi:type VI secretion system protein VasD
MPFTLENTAFRVHVFWWRARRKSTRLVYYFKFFKQCYSPKDRRYKRSILKYEKYIWFHTLLLSLLFFTAITSMGCGKKSDTAIPTTPVPPPTLINVEVIASAKVNPNRFGRASPIVVRLYELKGLTAFNSTDFNTLYTDDRSHLGDDLINREQFIVRPGGQKIYRREVSTESHYFAAIAAYRNIERALWHASAPVPANRTTNFTVLLNPLGLSIQAQ